MMIKFTTPSITFGIGRTYGTKRIEVSISELGFQFVCNLVPRRWGWIVYITKD